MKSVGIIQRVLPHYRHALFHALRTALAARGFELQLVYGDESPGTVPETFDLKAPWAHKVSNAYFRIGDRQLVWQPCWKYAADLDLVIVEQANRNLLNFALSLSRWVRKPARLGLWGHGRDFRASESSPTEALKRRMTMLADWWFAYTEISAGVMARSGVPRSKITVLDNTIDDTTFQNSIARFGTSERGLLRDKLGVPVGAPIALYCGGIYPEKRVEFLLEACAVVRSNVRDFHLVVVGDGPDSSKVRAAAALHPWIHYVGPSFGAERAAYFSISDLLLVPAHVGLVVVDSFVAGTPLFTTNVVGHGPEIAYLEPGANGIVTEHSIPRYAAAIEKYLSSPTMRSQLVTGCAASAKRYTLDHMVERFSSGVEQCVAQ